MTPKTHIRRLALASVLVALVLPPAAEAWVRSSGYDYSGVAFDNFGYLDKQFDLPSGRVAFSGVQSGFGASGAELRIGQTFHVNSDAILPTSYTAVPSARFHASGTVTCNPGSRYDPGTSTAIVSATFVRMKLVNGFYVTDAQSSEVELVRCTTSFPRSATVDADFVLPIPMVRFDRGASYRFHLALTLYADSSHSGSSNIHFAGPLTDRFSDGIDLTQIAFANQRPVARSYATSTDYLENLIRGTPLSGRVCDFDGYIAEMSLETNALSVDETSLSRGPASGCGGLSMTPTILAPGNYELEAKGKDNDRSISSTSRSDYSVTLMGSTSTSASGPGGLSNVAAAVIEVEKALNASGFTIGERVKTDGTVVAEGGTFDGSHTGVVRYDRRAGLASVTLDGILRWAGAVEQTGENWWQIAPVANPVVPSKEALAMNPPEIGAPLAS